MIIVTSQISHFSLHLKTHMTNAHEIIVIFARQHCILLWTFVTCKRKQIFNFGIQSEFLTLFNISSVLDPFLKFSYHCPMNSKLNTLQNIFHIWFEFLTIICAYCRKSFRDPETLQTHIIRIHWQWRPVLPPIVGIVNLLTYVNYVFSRYQKSEWDSNIDVKIATKGG